MLIRNSVFLLNNFVDSDYYASGKYKSEHSDT